VGEFSSEKIMNNQPANETMIETAVTYTIEVRGQLVVIEHVPARVCQETGEQFFSPETVERIHAIIAGGEKPARTMQTPVYEFAA
jgi:YgiT-type zinc finger domain-containing protein